MPENKQNDPLIQTVEKLIEAERKKREELCLKIEAIDQRIADLQRLYPSAKNDSQPASGLEAMPSRMKPVNLQLMKWLASQPVGAPYDDILQYCNEHQLMEEKFLKFFIRNYKSRRYELLAETESGNIFVTDRGRVFLSRMSDTENEVAALT